MTQTLTLRDWTVSFDPDEVQHYYDKVMHDWCPCNRCYNWRIVRERFVPNALSDQLQAFGLKLENCMWDSHYWNGRPTLPGYFRERPNYIIPGTIVREGKNPAFRYGKLGSIWITKERPREFMFRDNDFPDMREPVIYLRVRVPIPFLPKQMRSFDQHNDFRCPACNLTEFYVKGRLKSDSLIPRWYGVDLGARPQDFDVCFCLECGTPRFIRRR